MSEQEQDDQTVYHIKIKETPNRSLNDWLEGLQILPQENGETMLVGRFADQSALRGFMNRLWNFNFTILYLERIEHRREA